MKNLNNRNRIIKESLLVFNLLLFSGNKITTHLFGKYSSIVLIGILIILIYYYYKRVFFFILKSNVFKYFILIVLISSLYHLFIFNKVSYLGVLNHILKFFAGGIVLVYVGQNFSFRSFKVLSYLSVVSLAAFAVINLSGYGTNGIKIGYTENYILYSYIPDLDRYRNSGMFWEPGAYAGVINLCLLLNFQQLDHLFKKYKFHFSALVLALLSTQSTTGYIVFFMILLLKFIDFKKYGLRSIFLSSLIVISAFFLSSDFDFLGKKISGQLESSKTQAVGEFSNTRFGSFVFDLHYIKKNPLLGNGLLEETRYADHKYLFVGVNANQDIIGSGNGLSGSIAQFGIIYILLYFFLIISGKPGLDNYTKLVLIIILFFSLQGEQWLNFPLFLSLPFWNYRKS